MSDGCQANTSTFAHRKVTSALSYLGSRVALMVKVPPVPSSLAGTFLVVGGARWCVLDGSAALRRGALAGVGIRAFAGLGLLAGGARWHVLDGSAALRRGALAGVGARAFAGLGLHAGGA